MFLLHPEKIILLVIGIWSLGFTALTVGCAWVVKESPSGGGETLTLSLFNQVVGELPGDAFGSSLFLADVNGDGKSDFLVGAPFADPDGKSEGGMVYLYSGANGSLLWQYEGAIEDGHFGDAIASSSDVNDDQKADFIVGAPRSSSGRGQVDLLSGANGSLIWRQSGGAKDDSFGQAVLSLGRDYNGDGVLDFIVGIPESDPGGMTNAGSINILSGRDGSTLLQKNGEAENDHLGSTLVSAGSIFIVGAPDANPGGKVDAGSVYVYSAANGDLLYQISGEAAGGRFGSSLATGDVDGDGSSDIIVGAASANSNKGSVYVYSGSERKLLWQKNGNTAGENLGLSLTSADFNRDGKSDIIVGGKEKVYIFSGADGATLYQASQGGDFGFSVASGDVNGDGKSDLLVGARNSNNGRGSVWVFVGP